MNTVHTHLDSTVECLETRIAPAVVVWTGDVDGNWGTNSSGNTNWSGDVLPVDGDDLLFPLVAANRTNTNNLTGLDLHSITMGGVDYVISGNAISLTNGISDGSTAGANVLNLNIVLGFTETVTLSVASSTLTLGGVISGNGGIQKEGPGTLRLSGTQANTNATTTFINGGALELNKTAGVDAIAGPLVVGLNSGTEILRLLGADQIANTSSVTVFSGGIFDLNGNNETIASLQLRSNTSNAGSVTTGAATLTLGGNLSVIANGTGAVGASISGNLSLGNATRTFNIGDGTAAQDLNISAVISSGGFTKTGAGTLRLSGATSNTFTGTATVNDGVLELAKNGGAIAAIAIPNALVVGDDVGVGDATAKSNFSNQIADTASVTVSSDGAFQLPSGSDSIGALTLHTGTSSGASITTSGGGLTLGGDLNLVVTGTGAVGASINAPINLGSTARLIAVEDGNAAVDLDVTSVVSNGALTKSGPGTLRLGASNTYGGGTTVEDGTLLVDGTIGAVFVNGGILGGNGFVGAISASGGSVAPGSSPGKLTTNGNVALANGSTFSVELNGLIEVTEHDLLSVVGSVTLGGSLSVHTGFAPVDGNSFTIISNDGSDPVNGTFLGLPEGSIVDGGRHFYKISYVGGDGNDVVLIKVVLNPTISTDGHRATFTDADGDIVVVKTTVGKFSTDDILIRPTSDTSKGQLTMIDLSDNVGDFDGAKLTIEAVPGPEGGNGFANVGFINAPGTDLKIVTVDGDLGQIECGSGNGIALKSLTTQSIGELGLSTQVSGGILKSTFKGSVGKITVRGNVREGFLSVEGPEKAKIGKVLVTGSLIGGATANSGSIFSDAGIGSIRILGDVRSGTGESSGSIRTNGALGFVGISGQIVGQPDSNVLITAFGSVTEPTRGADVAIGSLTVLGSVERALILGGTNANSQALNADASIGRIVVNGSWTASSIATGVVAGADGFLGTSDDIKISGGGVRDRDGIFSQIAGITIKGQVFGTAGTTTDMFGIVSEQIRKAKISSAKLPFVAGERTNGDFFLIATTGLGATGLTSDFAILESIA
jgi:autotransporter-associated beta strand protein